MYRKKDIELAMFQFISSSILIEQSFLDFYRKLEMKFQQSLQHWQKSKLQIDSAFTPELTKW
jgi:hypothetical protein